MIYRKIFPASALKPYVLWYYVLEQDDYVPDALEIHTPPSGAVGLVFNYGDAGGIVQTDGTSIQTPPHFLAGQFTRNYTLRLRGKVGMIGAAFQPTGLAHLLGIPMVEFTGQRVDLRLVLGRAADALSDRVLEQETPEGRVRVLEHFLLEKLWQISLPGSIVDRALRSIVHHKGMLSIRQLSEDACISPRQFRRRFTEKVGLTPKRFARIKRFNYISQLMGTGYREWGEMVYRGGYYDQSHFIRDFCEFSGKSPSEFVNYQRQLARLVED